MFFNPMAACNRKIRLRAIADPMTVARPPKMLAPPRTTAVMTSSSIPVAASQRATLRRENIIIAAAPDATAEARVTTAIRAEPLFLGGTPGALFRSGDGGSGLFAGAGTSTMADLWRGRVVDVRRVGDDLRVDLAPRTAQVIAEPASTTITGPTAVTQGAP